MKNKQIIIPYKPRDAFKNYHATDKRFCVTVAHRRAGKTVARINKLIKSAVMNALPNPRYAYVAPYLKQAKDIAWVYLLHYTAPIIALGGKVNHSELSVTFPHNNAVIRLYGGDNADALRGVYFDGVAADEAQDMRPSLLSEVISPTLSDRKGWLDISGTPRGWANLLGQLVKTAQGNPNDWYLEVLPVSKTGLIDGEELNRQRQLMTPAQYNQEYECDFDSAVKGAYYAEALHKAQTSGRITNVPYDENKEVVTAWDLGFRDSTAIWFAQVVGFELRIIDHYEVAQKKLTDIARDIKAKGYVLGKCYLPHDGGAERLGSETIGQQLEDLGFEVEILTVERDVMPGINLTRNFIPKCWFDQTRCQLGIEALKAYREKYDEKRGLGLGPEHDWASHSADAFRYLARALSEERGSFSTQNETYRPVNVSWLGA